MQNVRRKRIVFALLAIVILIGTLLGSGSVKAESTNTKSERSNLKLRVGWYESYGFAMTDEDGNRTGLICDYLDEIAKYTGWEYEYVDGTAAELIKLLESGEVDVLGGMLKHSTVEGVLAFPEYSSGYIYTTLNALYDNTDINTSDYATLQGIIVGVNRKDTENIHKLDDFLKTNNLSVTRVSYDSYVDLKNALENGEVDSILTSDVQPSLGQRIVASFAQQPLYLATRPDEVQLLSMLNSALGRINSADPDFLTKQKLKHFPQYVSDKVSLSQHEREYISKLSPLKVAININQPPLQYFNKDGTADGIVTSIMEELTASTGIQFQYVPVENDAEARALVDVKKLDMVAGVNSYYDAAKVYNVVRTADYMPISMGYAMNKGVTKMPTNPTVAIVNGRNGAFLESGDVAVEYNTIDECLKAVNTGKADYAPISLYVYDYLARGHSYRNVSYVPLVNMESGLCLGIVKPVSPELLTILNKAVNTMSDATIQRIIMDKTVNYQSDINFSDFVNSNPISTIAVLLAAMAVVVVALIIYIFVLRNRARNSLYEAANIDDVTRHINFKRFKALAESYIKTGKAYALIFFDIDKFKVVNDIFGHEKGNKILKSISDILEQKLDNDELYTRVNADNFNVLMRYHSDCDIVERITDIAERISNCIDGYHIDLSFGIYKIGTDVDEVDAMSDRANIARRAIKDRVDAFYAFFDEGVRSSILKEKELENIMDSALDSGEFKLFLQPKFDLKTEHIMGAEALVRWNSTERGMIYPNDFIPLFEKNGFIRQLDKYMFEQACHFISELQLPKGAQMPVISVNLSRIHLNNLGLVDELVEIAKRYGVETNTIEIELTESAMFDNANRMIKAMQELKEAGFILSIDDFGTGYSSLSTLKNLPVDCIKFDRGFLLEGTVSARGRSIIANLIRLTRALGLTTVAEGVETIEQVELLRNVGCDCAQGYYYAKPMPAEQFKELMEAR